MLKKIFFSLVIFSICFSNFILGCDDVQFFQVPPSLQSLSLATLSGSRSFLEGFGDVVPQEMITTRICELNPGCESLSESNLYHAVETSLVNCIDLSVELKFSLSIYSLSPDGKKIVLGFGSGLIMLYDTNSLQCEKLWQGHDDSVLSISWKGRSDVFATCGANGIIKIWKAQDARYLTQTLTHRSLIGVGSTSIYWLDDSSKILTISTEKIILWDVNTLDLEPVESYYIKDDKIFLKLRGQNEEYFKFNQIKLDLLQLQLLLKTLTFKDQITIEQVQNLLLLYISLPESMRKVIDLHTKKFKSYLAYTICGPMILMQY